MVIKYTMKIHTHFPLAFLIMFFFILIISYLRSMKYDYIHLPVFLLQLLHLPLLSCPSLDLMSHFGFLLSFDNPLSPLELPKCGWL